jgi:hypothetical protein
MKGKQIPRQWKENKELILLRSLEAAHYTRVGRLSLTASECKWTPAACFKALHDTIVRQAGHSRWFTTTQTICRFSSSRTWPKAPPSAEL